MTSADDCITCDAGYSCSVGSASQSACLPGSYGPEAGRSTCLLCPAGKFTGNASNVWCQPCTRGYLCVEGASAPQPCPGGTHADQDVLANVGYLSDLNTECIECPAGTSCSVGSAEPSPCLAGSFGAAPRAFTCEQCPAGKFTGTAGNTACESCTQGYLCVRGSSAPQPWCAPRSSTCPPRPPQSYDFREYLPWGVRSDPVMTARVARTLIKPS